MNSVRFDKIIVAAVALCIALIHRVHVSRKPHDLQQALVPRLRFIHFYGATLNDTPTIGTLRLKIKRDFYSTNTPEM